LKNHSVYRHKTEREELQKAREAELAGLQAEVEKSTENIKLLQVCHITHQYLF
jgi:hypothetical protein